MRVGDLLLSVDNPGEGDAVSGLVFLLNHTAVYIRDFQYSIQGEGGCVGQLSWPGVGEGGLVSQPSRVWEKVVVSMS